MDDYDYIKIEKGTLFMIRGAAREDGATDTNRIVIFEIDNSNRFRRRELIYHYNTYKFYDLDRVCHNGHLVMCDGLKLAYDVADSEMYTDIWLYLKSLANPRLTGCVKMFLLSSRVKILKDQYENSTQNLVTSVEKIMLQLITLKGYNLHPVI